MNIYDNVVQKRSWGEVVEQRKQASKPNINAKKGYALCLVGFQRHSFL